MTQQERESALGQRKLWRLMAVDLESQHNDPLLFPGKVSVYSILNSVAGYRYSDFAGSTYFKKCPGPAQAGWGWFRCWISPVISSASSNTSIKNSIYI